MDERDMDIKILELMEANDKLEVMIGTDDQSEKIDIKSAQYFDTGDTLTTKGDAITDIKLSHKGERKVVVYFQIPGKYSLKCKGYEDR